MKHIIHHIQRFHRLRKKKDEGLSSWKHSVNEFNEKHFHWLEKFVEHSIPWLVLLLLAVLFLESSDILNFFGWQWLYSLSDFAHAYAGWIVWIDNIIIAFFVIDLYFSFFKKAKLWTFFKHYFLDIIAVFPFGLFIRAETVAAQEVQGAIHIAGRAEQEFATIAKGDVVARELSRIERFWVSVEGFLARLSKFIRPAARSGRVLRLYRLIDFFKLKRKRHNDKKGKVRQKKTGIRLKKKK
jgi:hypothetical protein